MTRIEGVRKAGPLVRFSDWYSQRRFGRVAEPVRVAAHSPWVFRGYGAFELALDRSKLIDDRLKELAIMKVATLVGCPFCIDIGSALGRAAGVSEEQLRALATYKDSSAFSSVEELALEYAEQMTRAPVEVPDELFAALQEHFNEAQLVELTAAIAWENYRSRFNHAFGIGSQGFSEGAYCPLPEQPVVG